MERNYDQLISQMTLEEKAGMCSGLDFWRLKGVERLGIPSIMVTDGPHGLRKQKEGETISVFSTACRLLAFLLLQALQALGTEN